MNSRILPSAMVGHVSGLASVAHLSSSVSSLVSFDRVSSADQEASGDRMSCVTNLMSGATRCM